MSASIAKVLARRNLSPAALAIATDRAALVEGLMAEAQALDAQNREFSRQLSHQLAGNADRVELSELPDGIGMFYGSYVNAEGERRRLDVMPPRELWLGDFGADAADADNWLVMLDGEELARAASVGALPTIAHALARRDATS